jgi:hypothetical protein
MDIHKQDIEESWRDGFSDGQDAMKFKILKLLKENRELESISQNGKKVYKIYGTVIDEIKKL